MKKFFVLIYLLFILCGIYAQNATVFSNPNDFSNPMSMLFQIMNAIRYDIIPSGAINPREELGAPIDYRWIGRHEIRDSTGLISIYQDLQREGGFGTPTILTTWTHFSENNSQIISIYRGIFNALEGAAVNERGRWPAPPLVMMTENSNLTTNRYAVFTLIALPGMYGNNSMNSEERWYIKIYTGHDHNVQLTVRLMGTYYIN